MNFINIREYFFKNKDKFFNILISIFFLIYIFKQSILAYMLPSIYYNTFFQGLLLIITLMFVFLKNDYLLKDLKSFKFKNILFLICSIFTSQLIFFETDKILINFIKLFMIMIIVLSISNQFNRYLELISDSIFASVLFVFFISNFFLPIASFDTPIWSKGSLGFTNPNIPGIFIFSAIFGYFIVNSRTKFFMSSAIYFFIYYVYQSYSRTATFSIVFLIIAFLIDNKLFTKSFKFISLFSNSIFLTYLLSSNLFKFHICCNSENFVFKINNILSYRLYQIFRFNWGNFNTEGPILKLFLIDSLIIEFIAYLGFISLFLYIIFYLDMFKFRREFFKPLIAINIVLIAGLFEGLFFKISPISIFLSTVFFDNFLKKLKIKSNFHYIKS